MGRSKKEIVIEEEKQLEEIETMSLDMQSNSMEQKALSLLPLQTVKVLKRIAYYIAKAGMTLKESCMLMDVDFADFEENMKLNPIIGKIIRMKELQYKKDLMYTISQKAKGGDDKLAQWLLATRYPDEFGAKKPGANFDDNEDVFFQAIEFIRAKGDNKGLINSESGTAVVVTRGKMQTENIKEVVGLNSPFERINNILKN